MKTALISVYEKSGIVEFSKNIENLGYMILSTSGTYEFLFKNGLKPVEISKYTEFSECLDGRVKTLHPKIYAGILADRLNPEHVKQINKLEIKEIEILVVNLYPFKETVNDKNKTHEEIIENIDIGGPAMIRAASKNFQNIIVLTDPEDYFFVADELKRTGCISIEKKMYFARKAFELTSHYDSIILEYFNKLTKSREYKKTFTMTFEKVQNLRYGENPHQNAAFYKEVISSQNFLINVEKFHGKELSFNNINDANSALELLKEFDDFSVVIVKHASPCGVGIGHSIYEAYVNAYNADPVSIFGGVVALNREVNESIAKEISKIFVEVVIAPSFSKESIEILSKKTNIRLLSNPDFYEDDQVIKTDIKKVSGGILVQDYDDGLLCEKNIKCVTKKQPTELEYKSLKFAWKIVKHVKSNAIVLANSKQTVGICGGQPNRIIALEVALKNAKDKTKNSVMASDAFFPFSDCAKLAIANGITAIIQPGGSIKDSDSIKVCDENGVSMIFTGIRHFKH
ncbi:MAG: bifunctional phosphoribosylaminoimidazolecarboxamide formyltransferase/IMP cyclohydrolase [Clostridiales bacterium]|jgi:phosphoribosylaminoimidazolecarboxamide formyltransferase/IMP cyclohydrolase|nr:bifunctional phosphoribosylaminoimidazolecarboxamide formyltransferase/IMP cyclohydrolase [Clostridiales bacterium]